ncbi:PLP-dependent aminotransferase family protein [Oenococcus kitaharae]|uniref:GntR family transcriptional regulator n=1 Tax=Oenococcus kitaharae DSM 17330 TaxID=1045004 RepID=G9WF48_9LACO|nr:PLP-dependent aminotransferase family protein [Oenococcus kitaharae]EHN58768.1 GntR family transcriptional regulator [Oenococcus kitaharae DSM 17330]OEY81885.1 aspartate aminotransferase [Oenococcus kitaharae]OEY84114.1 aspartate aminotransferase [Oenococcus kitaharae]OEY85526.1 aspartate aminotransferase [Oenococcus kitaharae]
MDQLASRIERTSHSGLDKLFAPAQPNQIIFSAGYPDPALFPKDALDRATQHVFSQGQDKLLQYNTAAGLPALRQKLADKMAQKDGIHTDTDHIMLTQGAQQAIDLTARLMLNKDDGLVVEGPTYIGALAAFQAYEPTFYEIPMAEDGMDMDNLEAVLKEHAVKMIYTVPDFQNPTGVVMSLEKRQRLIDLANRYDVIILEDGTYRDLRYDGENLPTVKSLDTQSRVIYVSSFSKIIAPGLRMGWLTADDNLYRDILALKSGADIESSNLMMSILNAYLDENDLQKHIQIVCDNYREKKNAMLDAMAKYLPSQARYTKPEGGFFVWLTMPEDFNMADFLDKQLVPQTGVRFTPSTNLFPSGTIQNGARINFTGESIANIERGIQELGQTLTAAWKEQAAYVEAD